jgi:hypothetical protein
MHREISLWNNPRFVEIVMMSKVIHVQKRKTQANNHAVIRTRTYALMFVLYIK